MSPIWIAVVFIAIISAFLAVDLPERKEEQISVRYEVIATSLMAYRNGVKCYIEANPAFLGTVSDTDIENAICWPPGYTSTGADWTNMIDANGTLYIYAQAASDDRLLDALFKKTRERVIIGYKDSGTGALRAVNGFNTAIALPAAIPADAVVIVGH